MASSKLIKQSMKQKHKTGRNQLLKPVKPLLASAIALALNAGVGASYAADTSAEFSTINAPNNEVHKRAYKWLSEQKAGQTLQFATVYGLNNCKRVTQDFESHTKQQAYCFESSTKPNRFFAVSGAYTLVNDARQASEDLNLDGFIVSSIDRIKQTRCEISGIVQELAPFCTTTAKTKSSDIELDTNLASAPSSLRAEKESNSNSLPSLVEAPIG